MFPQMIIVLQFLAGPRTATVEDCPYPWDIFSWSFVSFGEPQSNQGTCVSEQMG